VRRYWKRWAGALFVGGWALAATLLYNCTNISGIDDKVFDLGGSSGSDSGSGGAGAGSSAGGGGSGGQPPNLTFATPTWARRFGGTDTCLPRSLAVAPSGEIVIAGHFQGTITLGAQNHTAPPGSWSIFIAKLSATAEDVLWSDALADLTSTHAMGVAIDDNGKVYLGSAFTGSISLWNPATGQAQSYSSTNADAFVVVYDETGTQENHGVFAGTDGGQRISGLAVTEAGNMVVVGEHERDMPLGPNCSIADSPCPGGACDDSIFLAELAPDAGCVGARGFPSNSEQHGIAVAVDADGGVAFTGFVRGASDLCGDEVDAGADEDIFIGALGPGLTPCAWSGRWGDSNPQRGSGVSIDPVTGDIYVTGWFRGTGYIGDWSIASADRVVLLVRLDANGEVQYARQVGAAGQDLPAGSVLARPGGRALLAGAYEGELECGDHIVEAVDAGAMYLARFAPNGASMACQRFTASSWISVAEMAAKGADSIVLFGTFDGTLQLGDDELTAAGGGNMFLAELEID